MVFLYKSTITNSKGQLVSYYTIDPKKAKELPGRLTARKIDNIKVMGLRKCSKEIEK